MSLSIEEMNEAVDFEHIARHEAGHAVVCFVLGARKIELTFQDVIVQNYRVRGMINLWGTYLDQYESIPIMLAGYLAERQINPIRATALKGAQRDFEFVRGLHPFAANKEKVRGHQWRTETFRTPRDWALFLMGQARITMRILLRYRAAVEGIASVLYQRHELSPLEFLQTAAAHGLYGERVATLFADLERHEAEEPRDVDMLSDLHEELASLKGPPPLGTEDDSYGPFG